MPKGTEVPVRRTLFLPYAHRLRKKYREHTIEEIAREEDILLVRLAGPATLGGVALRFTESVEYWFRSLVDDDVKIKSLEPDRVERRVIVLNSLFDGNSSEVFWHEYFHLHFSPRNMPFASHRLHTYSTSVALDSQEERRANEFAAAMLIAEIHAGESAEDIARRYHVSLSLAEIAIRMRQHS